MQNEARQLFVAWIAFQRRPVSMQPYFNYKLVFLAFAFKNRYLRPLEYIIKVLPTLALFWRERPQVIWVQLAPAPLLFVVHFYKALFDRQVFIVADCHNSMFRTPWIRLPGALTLLNHCDLVLVHNDWVRKQAMAAGAAPEHLHTLETRPVQLDNEVVQTQDTFTRPWILYPCSFDPDEPIHTVLDTARLIPKITFVVTGKTARAQGLHNLADLPANVKIVGFLPKAEFDTLLHATDAVLGLTTREGVQLSVANEAVGTSKPMILANTQILKELFYKGAIYVDALNSHSIAQGCEEALSKKDELTKEVSELKAERNKRWLSQASEVERALKEILGEELSNGS